MARKRPLLTGEQWAKIEPLLPRLPSHSKGGGPWCDNRRVVEGILGIRKLALADAITAREQFWLHRSFEF